MSKEADTDKPTVMDSHIDNLFSAYKQDPNEVDEGEEVSDGKTVITPPQASIPQQPVIEPTTGTEDATIWKTRYTNLEKLVGRQGQELGELRALKAKIAELEKSSTKSNTEEKPTKSIDTLIADPDKFFEEKLLKSKLAEKEEIEKHQTIIRNNVNAVYQAVPELDSLTDIVLELAKKDGIPDVSKEMWFETIRTDPTYALQYARRAKERMELLNTVNQSKNVVKNISKGSRSQPLVTGSTGSTSKTDSLTEADVDGMSPAEIKKLLREKYNYRR